MKRTRFGTALAASFVFAASAALASEGVRKSSATVPTASLSERLSELAASERDALASLPRGRLAALTRRAGQDAGGRGGLSALFGGSGADEAAEAPEPFAYTPAALADVPVREGGPEWRCLTEALYFEARGESVRGQFAVAEAILNRVDAPAFPGTVCAVVHQGTGERYRCQFTFTCDGRPETIRNAAAFRTAGKIAALMLDGLPRRLTDGATYFHTPKVSPRWARRMERTATIGGHHFYRPPLEVSQN